MQEIRLTYYVIFTTSFGEAGILYRVEPFSIIRILLPGESREGILESIQETSRIKQGRQPKALRIADSIKKYFRGAPIPSYRDWMAMDGLTKLQQYVLAATAKIPFGSLRTYKDIATAIGRPRAYRFVGSALAKNPFPLLIPCHRVIRSDRSIGQFGGGVDMKRKLIELEAKYAGARDTGQ